MIVDVPFVYEAPARQPGKRKFRPTKLRASTSVLIREVGDADLPVAIEMQMKDPATGRYVHAEELRTRDALLYMPMIGFGGTRHLTPESLLEHIAKGIRSDLIRNVEYLEPTYRPEDEALLELDPSNAGNRESTAAKIARNAQDMVVCNGLLWRSTTDEMLLVAAPQDRISKPMVHVMWMRSALANHNVLDCERHFRLDQLPEALLALGLDVDPDDPESFGPHVLHLPVVHDPSVVRYRHDQGPAFKATALHAVSRYDDTGDPPEIAAAKAAFYAAIGPLVTAAEVAEPFRSFVAAVAAVHGEQRVAAWRRAIEKWEANPISDIAPVVGPRP